MEEEINNDSNECLSETSCEGSNDAINDKVAKERKYVLLTPVDTETLRDEGFKVTTEINGCIYGTLEYENIITPIIMEEGDDGENYVTAIIDDKESDSLEMLRVLFNKFDELMAIGDDNPVYIEYKIAERRLLNACEKTRRTIMA